MLILLFITAGFAREIKAAKTAFNFNNLYGSNYNPSSKSFSWVGDEILPSPETTGFSNNPRFTYLGFLAENDGVIQVDTLLKCDIASADDSCVDNSGNMLYKNNQNIRDIFDTKKFDCLETSSSYTFSPNYELIAFRTKYEKQWRHSYKASYKIYKTKFFGDQKGQATEEYLDSIDDVWYFAFQPMVNTYKEDDVSRLKIQYANLENNLYIKDYGISTDQIAIADDATAENGILNGVPDWVYEEEIIFTRATTEFSPNGNYLFYLKSFTKDVENVQYNYYAPSSDQRRRADYVKLQTKNDKNPRVETFKYSKPGGIVTSFEMYMCDVRIAPRCTKIDMPQESVDFLNDGTALIFAKAQFQKDTESSGNGPSESLQGCWISVMNRIQDKMAAMLIRPASMQTTNKPQFFQDATGHGWVDVYSKISASNDDNADFFLLFEPDACNKFMVTKDHGPNWEFTNGKNAVNEDICIQSITHTDQSHVYFLASTPGKSYERHLYRLYYLGIKDTDKPTTYADWECVTCIEFEGRTCGYASVSFAKTKDYGILTCSGPDVPYYLPIFINKDGLWHRDMDANDLVVSNDELIAKISDKYWPKRQFGYFKSDKYDFGNGYNYELWIPEGVDISSGEHPLLIEIYGGPGSNKNKEYKLFSEIKYYKKFT